MQTRLLLSQTVMEMASLTDLGRFAAGIALATDAKFIRPYVFLNLMIFYDDYC